jgi:cell wall-associated NlpC family hydrolase
VRCAVEVAPVRRTPRGDSEQVTQLLKNEPLRIRERRGRWTRIETAYEYEGWVEDRFLEDGDGRLPEALKITPSEAARIYLRAPYSWGGLTHDGVDCSGLIHVAYRLTGKLVPRDAWQQELVGTRVDADSMVAGDLVTYGTASRADHIAFWIGEGWILHATARDALGVTEEPEPPALHARRRMALRIQRDP